MNSRTVTLEVKTSGPLLAFDLFGRSQSLTPGTKAAIPGDAALTLQEMREQRSTDVTTVLHVGLERGTDVAVGVVAAWLYEKLNGRARSLRIDRVEVQIEKGEIEKILIERLELKD